MTRRRWEDARAKAEAEGCRAHPDSECEGPLETAHTIGRMYDRYVGASVRYVDPDDVVGLCQSAHRAYDEHRLDLLPLLDPLGPPYREMAAAVRHVGLEAARRRLAPSVYKAERELGEAARLAGDLGGDAA